VKKLLLCAAAGIAIAAVLPVLAYVLLPDQALQVGRRVPRWLAGLSTRHVTAAGHRIAYLEGGSGEPLVLLHGFGADKDSWPPIARILTRHFHVFALDLPGFGESTRDPAAAYGVGEQVERLEAFAQALGIAAPFHLGGNSMGGAIAGAYAARHPERLKSLWLIDPAGVRSARDSELIRLLDEGLNPMLVRSTADYTALVEMLFVQPPWIPPGLLPALARARGAHRDFDEKVFQDLLAGNFSLERTLQGSRVPTLIAWGARDRLVDASGAAILAAAMLQAQVHILQDVGHVPMIEQPAATAERFLDFQRTRR
jgi:pimeloyl-ACP methyl ester carboxylesterase